MQEVQGQTESARQRTGPLETLAALGHIRFPHLDTLAAGESTRVQERDHRSIMREPHIRAVVDMMHEVQERAPAV